MVFSRYFGAKNTELRDRIAALGTQLDATDRNRKEQADLALKTFELSQSLTEKWLTADFAEKRKLVEIVVLNFTLEGASIVPTINKPFDILAEGLKSHQIGAIGRQLNFSLLGQPSSMSQT